MKKFFSSLLAIMLCAILSFSNFACVDPPVYEGEPIVAVDGVNVQNVIDALGPINESEYITINVDFGMESGEEIFCGDGESDGYSDGYSELMLLSAEIKIKKTNSGYDFIARIVDSSMDTYSVENSRMCIVLYYVDGRMVVAYEVAGQVMSAESEEERKTFNAIINELNKEIAEDAEMRKTYEQILDMSNKVKAMFDSGALANLNETLDIDLAKTVNDAFTYLKTNRQKTLYETIIAEMEISQTEEEIEEIIFAVVEEFCADNPTIDVLIDRVIAVINEDLAPEDQINLHEIINTIEAEGLTAFAFCELINYIAEDEVLTPPQVDVSLYDYLNGLISGVRVNDLAQLMLGATDATVSDLVAQLLEVVKQITLGDLVYELFGIDISTFGVAFTELYANASLSTDSDSRLTSFSVEYNVSFSTLDEYGDRSAPFNMARLEVEISYEKFDDVIAIPQEVLDMLEANKNAENM